MAEFTPNYGLHQWEPTDNFLRTDFNEDFSRIDTALGRAERSAEASAYNVYNLMLQNYYEGKYTGYKKALLFDGFLDESGIAEKSEGMMLSEDGLVLCGRGQYSISDNYGNSVQVSLMDRSVTRTFTTTGAGILNNIQFYARSSDGNMQNCLLTLREYEGETIFSQTVEIQANRSYTVETGGVALRPGVLYQLTFGKCTAGIGSQSTSSRSAGYALSITPTPVTTGTVAVLPQEIEAAGRAGRAWVRHSGGTVGVTLNGQRMEQLSQRDTVSHQSMPCTETEWTLPQIPQGEPGQLGVTLELEAEPNKDLTVYDYGVAIL